MQSGWSARLAVRQMAKGSVSDEELEQGLASAGGLGGFVASAGARRDSPFGVEHVRSLRKEPATEPNGHVVQAIAPAAKTGPKPTTAEARKQSKPRAKPSVSEEANAPEEQSATKAESCSEKVSLPMPVELRDDITALAKKLQRMRTEKVERITPNTVMRVAIQVFLERFEPDRVPVSNTEEELLNVVRTHLKWK